jgi:hypothetical protein
LKHILFLQESRTRFTSIKVGMNNVAPMYHPRSSDWKLAHTRETQQIAMHAKVLQCSVCCYRANVTVDHSSFPLRSDQMNGIVRWQCRHESHGSPHGTKRVRRPMNYGHTISIPISSSEANGELWLIHSFSCLGLTCRDGKTLSWWTWTIALDVWCGLFLFFLHLVIMPYKNKNVQLAGFCCETD